MKRLEGKVVVITGGASGIGEATVRLFCSEGARCVIADIQEERGMALAKELRGAALFRRTDVSQEEDVEAAVKLAVTEFGRLDCMFNNAGTLGAAGPIADIPVHEFDRTLNILLRGAFLGIKHAATIMKDGGSIITTSSIAGMMGGIGPHVYSAAKAALLHLTKSVALELGERSIRVNAICPGVIVTPMALAPLGQVGISREQTEAAVRQKLAMYQPIRRAGEALDVAQCALWLASDESSFVTGQSIAVDGGVTSGLQWSQQPEFIKMPGRLS